MLEAIEEHHEQFYVQIQRGSQDGFAYDRYQARMYLILINALMDAGEEDASIKLDRYRANQ